MDDVDFVTEIEQKTLDAATAKARHAAAAMGSGYPGECLDCGDHSLRLIGGYCAECRDYRYARRHAQHTSFLLR